jgi:hypothetical protein
VDSGVKPADAPIWIAGRLTSLGNCPRSSGSSFHWNGSADLTYRRLRKWGMNGLPDRAAADQILLFPAGYCHHQKYPSI